MSVGFVAVGPGAADVPRAAPHMADSVAALRPPGGEPRVAVTGAR
ncbi:hypothetical protein [Streptomyces sp. AC627_RSS907]|nr:hypothetical protein [Streptomyces sp. AC627_RSS907]